MSVVPFLQIAACLGYTDVRDPNTIWRGSKLRVLYKVKDRLSVLGPVLGTCATDTVIN